MKSEEIESVIRATFGLLASAPQIELLIAGGLGRNAVLLRLSTSEAVPSASYLHVACRRDRAIYIKPSTQIIEVKFMAP